MFQCPRGLELLRMISTLRSGVWRFNALTGLSCYLIIMTKFLRSICFNALTGLSCYGWGIKSSRSGCRNCFNALTGLSCYGPSIALLPSFTLFQCPHGLELLPITRLISSRQIMFQCPLGLELLRSAVSSHWCSCRFQCPLGLELLQYGNKNLLSYNWFQCPLGLELLQQECPIF